MKMFALELQTTFNHWTLALVMALAGGGMTATASSRQTILLDGVWQIAEGVAPDAIPAAYSATVPVPGLVNLAQPPFPRVDEFDSREHLARQIQAKRVPDDWMQKYFLGKHEQPREYFWYRKTFRAPAEREVALLKINKAQFGAAVWLNDQKVGEDPGCYTASFHLLNGAIRWGGENTLVIRIGAHPAVLPDTYPTGSDFEKIKWTPGIYDSVSVIFCDNPVLETIQVAPRIASGEVVVQTRLKNYGAKSVITKLSHTIRTWKGNRKAASFQPESVALAPGAEQVVTRTLSIPKARLWSPEDPFLYVLESDAGGDSARTRFGMREFRFDAATGRAYLNGKPYYLRGSNITLHRFFEDPECSDLPWNEAWTRKLLGDLPRKLHWNFFRFCIGPVPDRWLEICDEEGLLIQNEFFIWTGGEPPKARGYLRRYDTNEVIRQYSAWMRDNWNHPSVVIWDANNESKDSIFGDTIIPAVRGLDLSDRPWENSYNLPVGPNDPIEYHPYMMWRSYLGKLTFKMSDFETMDGRPKKGDVPSLNHPIIINEYAWLWCNRDGTPTRLTENTYAQLVGTNITARERLDLWAYLLAGKTEFWRATRQYAGIVHFVYLTCSYPGVYTSDHFSDVRSLKLDPAFVDYVGESFKPLGVYLNFFQPTLAAGESREFTVRLTNDETRALRGQLTLSLETRDGRRLNQIRQPFDLVAGGADEQVLRLEVPRFAGDAVLKASAQVRGQPVRSATVSRRWVSIEE